MNTFEFFRFRFHLRALDAVEFPRVSANAIRGALGALLGANTPPDAARRLFTPGAALGPSPSGLADWPRPFVLRTGRLDGAVLRAGDGFFFDVHLFDGCIAMFSHMRNAFEQFATRGIGPGRGRAELARIEQLDTEDRAEPVSGAPGLPCVVSLEPGPETAARVCVRFLTPTELKCKGRLAAQPEFPVLFGRLRDRLSTLRALYGAGSLEIDCRGMGERAAAVRLVRAELAWEEIRRRSARTGQVHPLGGFTGIAEYEGPLTEFLPWLRAARWAGVGRQTVWGKGDMRVVGQGA